MANDKFLGIKFPTESDPTGKYLQMNRVGDTLGQLKSDISFYLTTQKGTRWMKPDFGTNLNAYLFQPLDNPTSVAIQNEITSGLQKYFQGISVKGIQIKTDERNHFFGFKISLEYSSSIFKENLEVDINF